MLGTNLKQCGDTLTGFGRKWPELSVIGRIWPERFRIFNMSADEHVRSYIERSTDDLWRIFEESMERVRRKYGAGTEKVWRKYGAGMEKWGFRVNGKR